MRITLIVAVADNGVIGSAGALPWRLPADLRHFKAVTMGKPVIMGRRTWHAIGRALPGRRNIVLTRDAAFQAEGVDVAHTIEEALAAAEPAEESMVIGGAEVYRQFLPLAQRIVMTEVHERAEGDTNFPAIDRSEWVEGHREDHPAGDGVPAFSFVTLDRRPRPQPPVSG